MAKKNNIYETLYEYTRALTVALGYRDIMTRLHSERVRDISMMIALKYGLHGRNVSAIRVASSFHDIGKIGIPDKVLMKPSRLDDEEWVIMKKHSEFGEDIIRSSRFKGCRRAAIAIRHHHEHFNGEGYPDSLAGYDIPICSRIITIADSYDAMAVTRSYHPARNHQEIMKVMRSEIGTKFDPQFMEIFCTEIERCPFRVE